MNSENPEKTVEADSHFVERMVNSVLEGESDVGGASIGSDGAKGGKKFSDGNSLIAAFRSFKNLKSPLKVLKPTTTDQKWQIWYWRRGAENDNKKWKEYLQRKSSFITRKEFWSAYNEVNGYEFGLLSRHFDYCVFKEGIVPMWEDPSNRGGGRWILEFPRKRDWRHIPYLDQIWLKVLLAITGTEDELYELVEHICGCVLMIRYHTNKIAIWTNSSNNTLINLKIGELLKASTGFTGRMYYLPHDSTTKKIEIKAEKSSHFGAKVVPELAIK